MWGSILYRMTCFNPRPREEGDQSPLLIRRSAHCFNPRPREEGDYISSAIRKPNVSFNPRPREEGDPKRLKVTWTHYVSIHALAKRATPNGSVIAYVDAGFNPRPREEGDS